MCPSRNDFVILLVFFLVIGLYFTAGCISRESQNITPGKNSTGAAVSTAVSETTMGSQSRETVTKDLPVLTPVRLHAGNLTLMFMVTDKHRDPAKETVSVDLTVKNVGNESVNDIQKNLSEIFVTDKYGTRYGVSTHVALIGLKPDEVRTGTIEVPHIPDNALPGLVFHYKFGNEEASWIIISQSAT